MKNINKRFIYIAIAAIGVFASSCTRELDTYEGVDGMYFNSEHMGTLTLSDTIDVSWGMKNSDITTQDIVLSVKLLGNTVPYDRAFDIVIEEAPRYVPNKKKEDTEDETDEDEDAGDMTGDGGEITEPVETVEEIPTLNAEPDIDYVIGSRTYVIPAGEAEALIPITLKRREDLHLYKRSFKVRIIENASLKFIYSRALPDYDEEGEVYMRAIDYQRVIRMDEDFPIPAWWLVRGEPYFGDWSQKKATLICDYFNIDREYWLNDQIAQGRLRFYGVEFQSYLNTQKTLGEPILEDDGTEMVMGYESQL